MKTLLSALLASVLFTTNAIAWTYYEDYDIFTNKDNSYYYIKTRNQSKDTWTRKSDNWPVMIALQCDKVNNGYELIMMFEDKLWGGVDINNPLIEVRYKIGNSSNIVRTESSTWIYNVAYKTLLVYNEKKDNKKFIKALLAGKEIIIGVSDSNGKYQAKVPAVSDTSKLKAFMNSC